MASGSVIAREYSGGRSRPPMKTRGLRNSMPLSTSTKPVTWSSLGARLAGDLLHVALVDVPRGHDDHAIAGPGDELFQEVESRHRGLFLSRRENAVDAELDERLQSLEGIAGHVEGAVEGDAHGARACDELARSLDVHAPVRRERADDGAVDAETLRGLDVAEHDVVLDVGVEEISSAGPDDDVEADLELLPGEANGSRARGEAAFEESAAKLDAPGPTLLGGDGALDGVHAGFDDHGRV